MWSDTPEGRQFIQDVSRNVVGEVAAEELELFPELAADYFANPQSARSQPPKDDALGFGLETVAVLTPVVLAMTKAVIGFVSAQVLQTAKDESASLLKEKIKAVFASLRKGAGLPTEKETPATSAPPVTAPTLNRGQLEQIKKLAVAEAVSFGVKPEDAEKMSLSLIGSLALAK
jgi:hypothetical protein